MREGEVISYIKTFFEKHDYKVQEESNIHGFRVDILAEKNGEKHFVECKGDGYLGSHEIQRMIGQIVSEMHEVGPSIHYALAMPYNLSEYLRGFSVEGIKALKLHLFIVGQGALYNGSVFYLDAESTINFIQTLSKNFENALRSLFTLKKQLL